MPVIERVPVRGDTRRDSASLSPMHLSARLKDRLALLLPLLGLLLAFGLLRPDVATAPGVAGPTSPPAPRTPGLSASTTGATDHLLRQVRDCVYRLELARAQRAIIELQRTTRSGEQIEVESIEELQRARRYADNVGSGLASALGDGRWAVVGDGLPVFVVDEVSGAVTTYEGQPLCP